MTSAGLAMRVVTLCVQFWDCIDLSALLATNATQTCVCTTKGLGTAFTRYLQATHHCEAVGLGHASARLKMGN